MPIPAVTFVHNTIQSSQNWGVRKALVTSTLCVVTMADPVADGTRPSCFQPSCGTRMVNTPNIMNRKYAVPITRKVLPTPRSDRMRKCAIKRTDSGDSIIAPPPNPIIARPVARPGRSGNPLDQGRYGRNVTEAQSGSANYPIAKKDDPELVPENSEVRNEETQRKANRRSKHRFPRPGGFQPFSKQCRREA